MVTFASVNFQLHGHTLFEAMQGGCVAEGRVIADWTQAQVFRRWTEDRYVADQYLWLQVNDQDKQPYQVSIFTNSRSPHCQLVNELAVGLRAAPLSSADNNWLLV